MSEKFAEQLEQLSSRIRTLVAELKKKDEEIESLKQAISTGRPIKEAEKRSGQSDDEATSRLSTKRICKGEPAKGSPETALKKQLSSENEQPQQQQHQHQLQQQTHQQHHQQQQPHQQHHQQQQRQQIVPKKKDPTTRTAATMKKPPPIIVKDCDSAKSLIRALESAIGSRKFETKIAKQSVVVRVTSSEDHQKAEKMLKERGYKYFTFKREDEKTQTLIIRHISPEWTNEEVRTGLQELVPALNLVKVDYFQTPYMRANKIANLRMVQIAPEEDASPLKALKFLSTQRIRVEAPNKRTDAVHCNNCQHAGHVANSCHLPSRCIKCADTHIRGECKVKPADQEPEKVEVISPNGKTTIKAITVTCCNCGGPHPANYSKCPKKAKPSYASAVRGPLPATSISYASVAKSATRAAPKAPPTNTAQSNKKPSLDLNVDEYVKDLQALLATVGNCSPVQKKCQILTLITSHVLKNHHD